MSPSTSTTFMRPRLSCGLDGPAQDLAGEQRTADHGRGHDEDRAEGHEEADEHRHPEADRERPVRGEHPAALLQPEAPARERHSDELDGEEPASDRGAQQRYHGLPED